MPTGSFGPTPLTPQEGTYWLTQLGFKRYAVDGQRKDPSNPDAMIAFSFILWARSTLDIVRWSAGHLSVRQSTELATAPVGAGDRILYDP